MAYITLNRQKLQHNYNHLHRLFLKKRVQWAVVTKLLCGNELFLSEIFRLGPLPLCDSRITNLKAIKHVNPDAETIYIKPPPSRSIPNVIRYADVSFNTELRTLKLLSAEAVKQGKIHKVVIMVELGERREGVMPSHIVPFYEEASALPGIRVIGVGTNFTCLSGVLPDYEKLSRLTECKKLLVDKSGKRLMWASGGSSVVLPLLINDQVPTELNHFRIGETLFFGTDVYHNTPLKGMRQDVITVYAEIIELIYKPLTPDGNIGKNLQGLTPKINPADAAKTSWRAILDLGLLDVESSRLTPIDSSIQCIGACSDMLVIDLGLNPQGYRTGSLIAFRTDYMGALRLMNSRYIQKKVEAL